MGREAWCVAVNLSHDNVRYRLLISLIFLENVFRSDFGTFEHNGERIFWKTDYYDRTMTQGSEHPGDLGQTVRVLTIMLASEY